MNLLKVARISRVRGEVDEQTISEYDLMQRFLNDVSLICLRRHRQCRKDH